ncbi:MAG: MBL fold metallo-hydrolase [Gluconobacter japonicus]|uniref:MBL fold metallo-hydrolase n=1 Tax=Gluconobacter japonicus TaxID=376620 RepID=UPI000AA2AA72|nr:MBL fold metallo-hydrolase [Gluconobacter japonicus]
MVPLNVKRVAVTPIRQNCTILWDERNHAIVVDPGGDVDDLLQELTGLTVDAILLTHGHLDHAGGADDLRTRLTEAQGQPVPVLGPDRRDGFLLSTIEKQAAHFGLSGMVSVVPDRFLEDGETLRLLGHDIEVRHLPGHTPGHVVFIDHASGRAIVGDTLFRRTVGRTDFAYGDSEALIAGIRRQLLSLPDETVVLCGHGMPTTIGEERRSNPFLVAGL